MNFDKKSSKTITKLNDNDLEKISGGGHWGSEHDTYKGNHVICRKCRLPAKYAEWYIEVFNCSIASYKCPHCGSNGNIENDVLVK